MQRLAQLSLRIKPVSTTSTRFVHSTLKNHNSQEKKLVKHLIADQKLITIEPQSTLDEALHLMLTHHIRHLPVVDKKNHGELLGVLTDRDIRLASSSPVLSPEINIADNMKKLAQHKVQEAMSHNLLTVTENDTIVDACKVMSMSKRGCLPVTKKNEKKLVGILTRSTMLDHLIRLMEPMQEATPTSSEQ